MAAPPSRDSIAGTPTNAQAKAGIGALWDYVVGRLGGDVAAPAATDAEKLAARTALGALSADSPSYIGTLTGGTGVVNLGSGQFYKGASGNVGVGTASPGYQFSVLSSLTGTTAGSNRLLDLRSNASGRDAFLGLGDGTNATAGIGYLNANLYLWVNGAERVRISTDGSQSSVIPGGSTLYPEFKCRAWVNFNGTTSPGTIRGSGNVSSVTKNGTGDYTVNFSTAMPDANYTVSAHAPSYNTTDLFRWLMVLGSTGTPTSFTTSGVRVTHGYQGVLSDCVAGYVAIFR